MSTELDKLEDELGRIAGSTEDPWRIGDQVLIKHENREGIITNIFEPSEGPAFAAMVSSLDIYGQAYDRVFWFHELAKRR